MRGRIVFERARRRRSNAAPSGAASLERQRGLRQIERLDLRLLVAAQHQRVLRRIQIQPDDRFELFGELRIAAAIERLDEVRLHAVLLPDAAHAGLA